VLTLQTLPADDFAAPGAMDPARWPASRCMPALPPNPVSAKSSNDCAAPSAASRLGETPVPAAQRPSALSPEDPVPGWHHARDLRAVGLHRQAGRPGASAQSPPHPLSRGVCPQRPRSGADHAGPAGGKGTRLNLPSRSLGEYLPSSAPPWAGHSASSACSSSTSKRVRPVAAPSS
jgi:hypothetical protein